MIRAAPVPVKKPKTEGLEFRPVPVASILSGMTDALTTVVGDYGLYAVFLLMLRGRGRCPPRARQ